MTTERWFRCPHPVCRHTFRDPEAVPGSTTRCPACARRMTARPASMRAILEERERLAAAGGAGDPAIARLPLAVLVDDVRSLWNVGSIFRTADACGVALVVLAGITGCPPRPAISKTALGGDLAVPWRYCAGAVEALAGLIADGWTPVALETEAGGVPLPELRWPARPCLVVGHETRGVSPEVLDRCDLRVSIPMRGVKDSLNVAVAFGIAAYAASQALR